MEVFNLFFNFMYLFIYLSIIYLILVGCPNKQIISTMAKKLHNKPNSKSKTHKQNKPGTKTKKKQTTYKPQSRQQLQSIIKVQAHDIKNKMKRIQIHQKRKLQKNMLKMKQRKQRQKLPAEQRQQPQTIQDKQVANQQQVQEYQQKQFDQFAKILNDALPVKILLTTQIKPPVKIYDMIRELMMVFCNANFYPRDKMRLDEIYQYARTLNYTHVVVVRFTHGWELLVRHLQGALAVFKVTSVEFQKDIKRHGLATDHIPELILNNFDSKVGVRVGRLLATLFPQQPEFRGRRVVTFHNQRDFIFFRHHRYIFQDGFEGVNMQEIGPRMTLRLKKLVAGDKEKVEGVEFEARDNMYVDRKAVYL